MRLTLSTLRCPASAAPETRTFDNGEISIGRGADNGWVLADPERHLSKRHCTVVLHGSDWYVTDQSTNGTFVNADSDRLALAGPRRLSDGDRLRLGDYEMEVRLSAARVTTAWSDPFAPQYHDRDPASGPFHVDPFPPSSPAGLSADPAIRLLSDFDPLAPTEDAIWGRPIQTDNTPATTDAFRPPVTAAALLPDDWADDLLPDPSTPYSPKQPPFDPARPVFEAAPAAPPVAEAYAPPITAPVPSSTPPVAEHGLLEAFLRGAGLENTQVSDPLALMEQMGATMRAMVFGLRQALIARSEVKSEFRIERTMISASGNNPLKFSADDDDALAALLGNRRSSMAAPAAVADSLEDMRLHELATIAALQAAVRDLVARFDPAKLKQEAGGGGLPMGRKARAWDAFEVLHASVSDGLGDDFDSVFGKSFARFYEQAHDEIAGREARNP